MPEGTKYDSVLDALKVTQVEYDCEIMDATHQMSKESVILGASTGELRNWAKEWIDDHEWFEEFDGATFGAIVEFSETDPKNLTRWHAQGDAASALRVMAEEAVVEDIVSEARDAQQRVEEKEVSVDGGN